MYAHFRSLEFFAITILTVSFFVSCGTPTAGRSTGNATIGSRQVKFALDGGGGVVARPDAATVSFTEGKVVVEKARVLVNDEEVAKLPEDAKLVEVDYTAGTLTITADGSKVYETKLRK